MLTFVLILLIFLLFIGMPIGFALFAVGSLGLYLKIGYDGMEGILATSVYRGVNDFSFSAIPLFILMAHFISKSKIADELFDAVLKWLGHFPGGAGVATVLASAGFGTLSGSSIAATSVMSQIAIPKMVQSRYSESFSAGLVASSTGTLAVLIPPSIPMIIYGIQTENSIGKLLIAGVLPGLLLALLLCITVVVVGVRQNSRTEKYSWAARWRSLKHIWPAVLLVVIVLIIIYFGIGTSTEAAAFGAAGALAIGLVLRRLNFHMVLDSLLTTAKQSCMIFVMIVGAHIFAYYITLTGIGQNILNAVAASGMPPWSVLLLIIIIFLFLGMFIESIGALLLVLPLGYPLLIGLGYDPIWLGVIVVLLIEIGLVLPPVGMNLYITGELSGIAIKKVLTGSIPFIIVLLVTVLILTVFPQIATFLPSIM